MSCTTSVARAGGRARSLVPGWLAAAAVGALILVVALGPAHAQDRPAAPVGGQRTVAAVRECATLRDVPLADVGGSGSAVRSAAVSAQAGAEACVVDGVLAPSIRFRASLPVRTWTRRYLQTGCGGLCGRVSLSAGAADGCVPYESGGFVVAGTDMGHEGGGGEFGRDPQLRADFAHRAVHLTALAAKALIRAYYGRDAAYSYFSGCSDGGREALIEAQRYPGDFDGIIAGAPAMAFQVQNSLYHGWQARSNTGPDGSPILLAARLPLLHQAVLQACDALDGQSDGLVSDPRGCRFDPGVLRCGASALAQDSLCLTAAEVEAARSLYDGPRDAATGVRLTAGGPQPGSELGWAGVFVPRDADQQIFSERIALDALRYLIFEEPAAPDFRLADLRFDLATFERLRARHPLFDATDPDLTAFAARGGKLILWHGWSDPHISPLNTIAYHEALAATLGAARRDGVERLYLLPGVGHCGGGEGPSVVDLLTPLLEWVERGVAPQAVVARPRSQERSAAGAGQPTGGAARPGQPGQLAAPPAAGTPRPVFPYPMIAVFDGHGDAADPSRYQPRMPASLPPLPDWAGADFFRPFAPRPR